MAEAPTLIARYRVRPGRAEAAERWLQEVLAPAASSAVPAPFQALRSTDGEVLVFLFFGGEPDGWEMDRFLEREYGAERAAEELAAFVDLLEGEPDFRAYTEIAL